MTRMYASREAAKKTESKRAWDGKPRGIQGSFPRDWQDSRVNVSNPLRGPSPFAAPTAAPIQRKATVSVPSDPLEKAADEGAEKLLRMEEPAFENGASGTIQRKCASCEDEDESRVKSVAPLQRKCATCDEENEKSVVQTKSESTASAGNSVGATNGAPHPDMHAIAQRGMSGSSGALPWFDSIQKSFGRHDVSGIAAHTDGAATDAARAMQALAFTTKHHVVFRGRPTLHTAAHEAAHAIQQRAGVQLAGGMGAIGDRYERHADAVADLVVNGQSAEALLDAYSGQTSSLPVIQRAPATEENEEPGDNKVCRVRPNAPKLIRDDGHFSRLPEETKVRVLGPLIKTAGRKENGKAEELILARVVVKDLPPKADESLQKQLIHLRGKIQSHALHKCESLSPGTPPEPEVTKVIAPAQSRSAQPIKPGAYRVISGATPLVVTRWPNSSRDVEPKDGKSPIVNLPIGADVHVSNVEKGANNTTWAWITVEKATDQHLIGTKGKIRTPSLIARPEEPKKAAGGASDTSTSNHTHATIDPFGLDVEKDAVWIRMWDYIGRDGDLFVRTLSNVSATREKYEKVVHGGLTPITDDQRALFETQIKTLIRMTALEAMAKHRSVIVARRKEMLDVLRLSAGGTGSPKAKAILAIQDAALYIDEWKTKEEQLKKSQRDLLTIEIDTRTRLGAPPIDEWFINLMESTKRDRSSSINNIRQNAENAVTQSGRNPKDLTLILQGNARAMRELRGEQIKGVVQAQAAVYAVMPFFAKLPAPDALKTRTDDALISAVDHGYEEVLHDVDRAIVLIGRGDIDPFDLPVPVEEVKASLPKGMTPILEQLKKDHHEKELWMTLGLTMAQAILVLLPVIGQLGALARGASLTARLARTTGVVSAGAGQVLPWVAAGADLGLAGVQTGDMATRHQIANASTSPDKGMLGVDKPSELEWVIQGATLLLSGLGIYTSAKGARDATRAKAFEGEARAIEEADVLPPTRRAHEPPKTTVDDVPTAQRRGTEKLAAGLSTQDEPMVFAAGAKLGDAPTPEAIRIGTCRMEEHPEFPATVAKLKAEGVELVPTSVDNVSVAVVHHVDKTGTVLRIEKTIQVAPGMRYLDLEHEVGHVEQWKKIGRPPTHQVKNGVYLRGGKQLAGIFTEWQDKVTEYQNRLIEFLRLADRNAPSALLREHGEGVLAWREQYQKVKEKIAMSETKTAWEKQLYADDPALGIRALEIRFNQKWKEIIP